MPKILRFKTYHHLKILYFIRYLGDAFFYAFFVYYLGTISLTKSNIAFITALMPLLAFFGSLIFQQVAKNININRIMMFVFAIIEGLALALFVIFQLHEFVPILVFVFFTGVLNNPYYSILDGFSGTYIAKENKSYSSMRVMGTLAYLFATLIGGFIISDSSYFVLFSMSAFLILFSSIHGFLCRRNQTSSFK